jgi:RNA polymerase sigma-70 factor (ECF subfamily)
LRPANRERYDTFIFRRSVVAERSFSRSLGGGVAAMNTTPASLLDRLQGSAREADWERFAELYTPLLYGWARASGLNAEDAADLVQDVFTLLVRKLPEFRYDPQRSFRGWLKTVLLNRRRETARRPTVPTVPDLQDVAHPSDADGPLGLERREHQEWLTARALQLMQREFEPATWRACWAQVVEGRPAAEVAAELGLTTGAAYAAKSRVLRRLRRELRGLLD